MNRSLRPLASVDDFPAFRAGFARVFPSNMTPPGNNTGTNSTPAVHIDLTSDNEDEPFVWDLTGDSPEPESENQPLKPPSPETESSHATGAKQSLPIQSKSPPARSTPVETSQSQSKILKNASGSLLPQPKFSPSSASGTQSDIGQAAPRLDEGFIALPLNRSLADEDIGEDDEWPNNLDTPSKRSRGRASSQKSFDHSTGTDSPLVTRNKEKRARMKNVQDGPRRDESPREVMTRRSMSIEQQSHIQQLEIAELEHSLNRFLQKVLDDHAETTRWLLLDSKRLVEERKSAFTDKVSPFASMQPVHTLDGEAIPEGTTKLKLDTFVSTATRSN